MKVEIVPAKNLKEMEDISETFFENKFKIQKRDDNFILMKRRRYGNFYVHILCIFIALFFFYPVIIVNVVYFAYSFIWKSPFVLITTETTDDEGKALEFSEIKEVLEKANALF